MRLCFKCTVCRDLRRVFIFLNITIKVINDEFAVEVSADMSIDILGAIRPWKPRRFALKQ